MTPEACSKKQLPAADLPFFPKSLLNLEPALLNQAVETFTALIGGGRRSRRDPRSTAV